jgi:predicted enzyme related to lactoylglutathione lyase
MAKKTASKKKSTRTTSKKAAKKKTPKNKPAAAKKTSKKKKSAKKTARSTATRKPASSASKKKTTTSRRTQPRKRGLGVKSQHVDFLSYKVDQVRKFYEEMLELPAETRDTEGLNYLVVTTSSSSSLGFMPPHPEMRSEQPVPREPTLYFLVDDLDAVYAKLLAKGVGLLGPPQEMPWGHRVLSTMDPEGRMIMFGERPKKRQ